MKTTVRKVVAQVEPDGEGCLVMWESGVVEATSAKALRKQIDRQNNKAVQRDPDTAVITVIDWTDCPAGWIPPEGQL